MAATPGYAPVLHDDGRYDVLACSIARTGAFSAMGVADPQPSAYRPPAYPYFLAGIHALTGCDPAASPTADPTWPRIAGAILGAIAVVMAAWLALRWWGRRAAIVTGALGAVYGPAIVVGSQLLSEALFNVFMLAAIAAAVRLREAQRPLRWAVVAGVAAGLATLTRANGLFVLLSVAVGVWTGRPRLRPSALAGPAIVVAAAALVVVPWTIRNAIVVHAFIPVSDEVGGTLAGTYNDVSRTDAGQPASWRPPRSVPRYRPIFQEVKRLGLSEVTLENRLRSSALDYAAAHPTYVAEVGWRNTLRLAGVLGRDQLLGDARALRLPEWSARVSFVMAEFVALLALLGALSGAARGSPRFVWAAALLLLASTVFVNAESMRFQVPLAPYEWWLAGAALAWVSARARRGARHGAVA